MAFPHSNINTESMVVEKFLVGVNTIVSQRVLRDLAAIHSDHTMRQGTIHYELSPILDEMFIALRAYLFKGMRTEKKTLTVLVPATWFDHLKHDMLASGKAWRIWLVKTFSPKVNMKTETKEVEYIRVCPHNDTYFSDSDMHLRFLMWKDDNYSGGHYDAP